jgi:antitoxin component YwqK of YwqJK toxin-antitoxin module
MTKMVKSVTLFRNDFMNHPKQESEAENKGFKYSYTELDEHGNQVLELKYSGSGEIEEKEVYTYNSAGKLAEEISYLTDEEVSEHKTFEYNQDGLLVTAFKHYADGSKDKINYEHDAKGNIISKTTIDADDEVESKEVYEWDNKHLLKKSVYEYGELVQEEANVLDENNNLVESTTWTAEDGRSKTVNQYDNKNNLIKTLVYNKDDKLVSKTLYSYNESGKPVGVEYESVRRKSSTTINYDEHGNATEQTEFNGTGEINNQALRKFNEQNEVIETIVTIDQHGMGLNQHYMLTYKYDYY